MMELSEAEYRLEGMDMDDICERASGLNIKIPEYAVKEEAIKIVMAYFENEDGHENNGDVFDEEEDADDEEDSEDAEDDTDRDGDIPPSEIEEEQYCKTCEKRLSLEVLLCKDCSASAMIEC